MEGEFGIDCMYNFNERSLKKAYKPGAESHSREGFKFLFSLNGIFVCLAAEPTVNMSYLSLKVVVASAQPRAGQRCAFTIWVYKSIINQ